MQPLMWHQRGHMVGWCPLHQSWLQVSGGCQSEQDGGLASILAGVDLHTRALCCSKERGCSKHIRIPKPCVPSCSRHLGLPRTLTPEILACASVHCVVRTGSGTGSQQTRKLCQRRQGGNRSGCHHEPAWEEKTLPWAEQPHSPAIAPLHIRQNLFSRLKRSSLEKEEDLGPGCVLQRASPSLRKEQQQVFRRPDKGDGIPWGAPEYTEGGLGLPGLALTQEITGHPELRPHGGSWPKPSATSPGRGLARGSRARHSREMYLHVEQVELHRIS